MASLAPQHVARENPIHLDFYEKKLFLQAFATNRVESKLPKFVFIVFEDDYNQHWEYANIRIVQTKEYGGANRVQNGLCNFKPYGMFAAYSLFINVEDAVWYSKCLVSKILNIPPQHL